MDKTIYKIEQEVLEDVFVQPRVTNEVLLRQAAHKVIDDLPLKNIIELFNLEIVNPRVYPSKYPEKLLQNLRDKRTFLIRGEIEI